MLPEAEKFNKDLNQWQEDFLVSARNAFKIVFFGMAKPLFEKYPEIKTVSFLTEMDAWDGPDCGQEPCIDSGQFLVNEFDWVNVCIEEAREARPFLCAENDMLVDFVDYSEELEKDFEQIDWTLVNQCFNNAEDTIEIRVFRNGLVVSQKVD